MLLIDDGAEADLDLYTDEQVLHISSCCDEIDRAVEFVREAIECTGISTDDEVDVIIAFSEVLTNAIKHGNGEDVNK